VSKVHRDHITRPTIRITGADGQELASPEEVDLFAELDVAIVDTLEDLDAPVGIEHPETGLVPDELQEQRLASVV
jgi:hypothetical protein